MKVFHGLVNYGTQSGLFAKELRAKGYDAISVTKPDVYKRLTDVELKHGGNLLQKLLKHSWNLIFKIFCFFKYDIFHFYYGNTLLPKQIDLPFYRYFGKKVVMEYLGGDIQSYSVVVDRYRFGEDHRFYHQAKSHDMKIKRRYNYERQYTSLEIVCAPCYSEYIENKFNVIPLGVDLESYEYRPLQISDKIIILHAPTDPVFKGTKIIEAAVHNLINEGYFIEYVKATNVTHDKLVEMYEKCTIFIDQISIGWYGTASIEAMALGKPTCAFIDERYFKYINYGEEIPIVNINKENCYYILKELVQDRRKIKSLSKRCREFVEKHHDIKKNTEILIDYYKKL